MRSVLEGDFAFLLHLSGHSFILFLSSAVVFLVEAVPFMRADHRQGQAAGLFHQEKALP